MLPSIFASPLGIFLAVVALGVLIIVHEGGHYYIARLSGMRVDRFSIGFGPPIATFQRGETTFQISAIPLGGYVHIAGLNPEDDTIQPDDPRSYPNRPVYQRAATIFAGPATNYVVATLTILFVYTFFGLPTPSGPPIVVSLVKDYPAAAAGVQSGDEVTSLGGRPVKDRAEVVKRVNENGDKPIEIVLLRDKREVRYTLTPKKDGATFFLGVGIEPRDAVWARTTIGEEVREAFWFPVRQSQASLAMLGAALQRKVKPEFTGPLGIVSEMKKQILRGPAEGLSIVAFISTLLGLFNLLPLPALDGGRLVFLAYEGILRRKFPERAEQIVHLVGMIALFSFILYITLLKDVPRLFFK